MDEQVFVLTWGSLPEKAGQMRGIMCAFSFDEEFRREIFLTAQKAGFKNLSRDAISFLKFLLKDYVFVPDPFIEFYQYPQIFKELPFGDCDDVTIFIGAVLSVLRIPHQMIFLLDPAPSYELRHVFIEAFPEGRRFEIDFASGDTEPRIMETEGPVFSEKFNKDVMKIFLNSNNSRK